MAVKRCCGAGRGGGGMVIYLTVGQKKSGALCNLVWSCNVVYAICMPMVCL